MRKQKKTRVVIPEMLDHLPADDPAARRSRRDLRRINFLMGNERWVCATATAFPAAAKFGIMESGAGDGQLYGKLPRLFPKAPVTACDLAPRPGWNGGRAIFLKWRPFGRVRLSPRKLPPLEPAEDGIGILVRRINSVLPFCEFGNTIQV